VVAAALVVTQVEMAYRAVVVVVQILLLLQQVVMA
jgi:hypothetical protein